MKQDILVKLKTAEVENARRIKDAHKRADELVKEARDQVVQILREARDDARKELEKQVAEARQTLASEREEILNEGQKREKRLRTQYEKNVDAHLEKAMKAFARSLDA